MEEEKLLKAISILREEEKNRKDKRKFDQTLDLIINLKDFDARRQSFNVFVTLPKKFTRKRIAAFFEKHSKIVDVIKKDDFAKFKDKKDIKKLLKKYDNFIANAKLMPAVATTFGRVLGPSGKMPSPQLGILVNEDEEEIKKLIEKVDSTLKISVKDPSIKMGIGKESLSDQELVRNIHTAYTKITDNLPKKKDNIRNVKIEFTMGKPVNVEL